MAVVKKPARRQDNTVLQAFLVIFIVLFVAACGLYWWMFNQKEELRLVKEQQAVDLVKREGMVSERDVRIKELEEVIKDPVKGLEQKIVGLEEKWQERDHRVAETERARDEQVEAKKNIEEEIKKRVEEKDKKIAEINEEVGKLTQTIDAERDKFNKEVKVKTDKVTELEGTVVKERTERSNEKSRTDEEIRSLRERLEQVLLAEREFLGKGLEADGEVLESDPQTGYVWVNLGKQNNLKYGLKFRVYQVGKGGRIKEKGDIEVRQVGDATSKAVVVKHNPADPMVKGDLIANRTFHPKKKKLFVIAGEFKKYTHEEMKFYVQENGGSVGDQLTVNTNYLVLGVGGTEVEGMKKEAMYLQVPILSEDELYRYIGD
ncbi:MAG: BRCT domain-containing protein [Planctomycetota bacterium]